MYVYMYVYMYAYIYIYIYIEREICILDKAKSISRVVRKGDDTLGNSHRARISQFELFELFLLLKLDTQISRSHSISVNGIPPPHLNCVSGFVVASRALIASRTLSLHLGP